MNRIINGSCQRIVKLLEGIGVCVCRKRHFFGPVPGKTACPVLDHAQALFFGEKIADLGQQ
ncbi:MAG: hypothetical protein IIZ49_00570, partial [Oscillospiraceae bacterium]|nr:hypothetical protein [Oscillospiraceae bacterium]